MNWQIHIQTIKIINAPNDTAFGYSVFRFVKIETNNNIIEPNITGDNVYEYAFITELNCDILAPAPIILPKKLNKATDNIISLK